MKAHERICYTCINSKDPDFDLDLEGNPPEKSHRQNYVPVGIKTMAAAPAAAGFHF